MGDCVSMINISNCKTKEKTNKIYIYYRTAFFKKWLVNRPISLAYTTGVRLFYFYGYGQKFQKMLLSKSRDTKLHSGLHEMVCKLHHPRANLSGH